MSAFRVIYRPVSTVLCNTYFTLKIEKQVCIIEIYRTKYTHLHTEKKSLSMAYTVQFYDKNNN